MKLRMHENSLFAILLRSPWWISVVVAIGLFAVVRMFVPAVYAVFSASPFLVIAGIAGWRQLRAPGAGRVQERLEDLRKMSWEQFSGEVEAAFRAEAAATVTSTWSETACGVSSPASAGKPCAPAPSRSAISSQPPSAAAPKAASTSRPARRRRTRARSARRKASRCSPTRSSSSSSGPLAEEPAAAERGRQRDAAGARRVVDLGACVEAARGEAPGVLDLELEGGDRGRLGHHGKKAGELRARAQEHASARGVEAHERPVRTGQAAGEEAPARRVALRVGRH